MKQSQDQVRASSKSGEGVAAKKTRLTPMMEQYLALKEEHSDCLLFFRMGDFYEMFFDDAITASRELEITLTGRDCGLEERAPMCGVPYHSVNGYLNTLIAKGYKVAIGEQLTDPKESNGIVERGVVRIVTPGTVIEETMLEREKNNYIACLCCDEDEAVIGLAWADVSTGSFHVVELRDNAPAALQEELARTKPAELIISQVFSDQERHAALLAELKKNTMNMYVGSYADWAFQIDTAQKNLCTHFAVASLAGYGMEEMSQGVRAAGALLAYLNETQKNTLAHINKIRVEHRGRSMLLDATTRRNLELTQTLRGTKAKKGTLFGLLDRTNTAMGARMLRAWIDQPLLDLKAIDNRLEAVDELVSNWMLRDSLTTNFQDIYDMERIASRIAYGTLNARDALSLKRSLAVLPEIKRDISLCHASGMQTLFAQLDEMQDIYDLLERAVALDPPVGLKEGGLIRSGYHEQIDALRTASQRGKDWLAELEKRERESTGIKNLKIGYNKVFGYYIEVTKSNLDQVPFRFQRKQTLANAERYITQELKELETQILGAEEKSVYLEYEVFTELRALLGQQIQRIQQSATVLAQLDAYRSLAHVAQENDYVRPQMHDGYVLTINEGRHPVVERMESGRFVANDTVMDEENRLLIITGPNMVGKSTYMRQVALIVLMAHIGSFVPARNANIPLTDRIFTRVGASDDLAGGQSTFMVEMNETANILQNASSRSLLLLDEIGRGTSTFDGLSIAWAVCEHIADHVRCGAKTLFSTHYHELSELEGILEGVVNYRITAKELGENIVFLRKVVRGGTDKSFGIQVARLAGIPQDVIDRAKAILLQLEAADLNHPKRDVGGGQDGQNSSMGSARNPIDHAILEKNALLKELANLEIDAMTPLEALSQLNELKRQARELC